MTEKEKRLAEIESKCVIINDGARYYSSILYHRNVGDSMTWLITQLKASWEREKVMEEALKVIENQDLYTMGCDCYKVAREYIAKIEGME